MGVERERQTDRERERERDRERVAGGDAAFLFIRKAGG